MNLSTRKTINQETLKFGISPLHAWLRCFECILHIGYRLNVKKWRVVNEIDKTSVANNKKRMQKMFRTKMSLIVDYPKPGGSGNTNDGNTARKVFREPTLFSEITGVDLILISHLATNKGALNSGFKINIQNFTSLCKTTFDRYVSKYKWFYMPVTMHKILVHGPDIIKTLPLPIGVFSEEAQEKDTNLLNLSD